jgi:long-chain fatty acid transport protein
MRRRLSRAAIAAALVVCPRLALAGGFDELPDQGAQALGRGATFTAKADDATALHWNVAGLARQRGTKVQLSANVQMNTFYFARGGRYPDDPADPATPWGRKPFPVVEDKNTSFVLPMLVATTDLGVFDRLTFGLGVFAPSATSRTFPIGVDGMPAPSRYDYVQSRSAVFFPTLGAAYRVTRSLDIGVGGQLAVADFDELTIAYADAGTGCKTVEDVRCDAEGRLVAKGVGTAASIGALARVTPNVQLGAQIRTPASVAAEGTATTKLRGSPLPEGPATLTLDLPWVVRAGARYVAMDRTFEVYDLELDATYEGWGSAQSQGPTVVTTDPAGGATPTSITSLHRWNDTFSIRGGGAYNFTVGTDDVLSVRAGAFYDSPATESAYTRLDVNTLPKVAGTVGVGFRSGAFAFHLAYAAVGSLTRTVTDGEIRPSNGAKGGRPVDGADKPLPAVNNGVYQAFTHVVSLGVEVRFDAFFGKRKVTYGDPQYEPVDEESDAEAKRKDTRSAMRGTR